MIDLQRLNKDKFEEWVKDTISEWKEQRSEMFLYTKNDYNTRCVLAMDLRTFLTQKCREGGIISNLSVYSIVMEKVQTSSNRWGSSYQVMFPIGEYGPGVYVHTDGENEINVGFMSKQFDVIEENGERFQVIYEDGRPEKSKDEEERMRTDRASRACEELNALKSYRKEDE